MGAEISPETSYQVTFSGTSDSEKRSNQHQSEIGSGSDHRVTGQRRQYADNSACAYDVETKDIKFSLKARYGG
jgi:hypothetical protein